VYPVRPGFAGGSDTSAAAADSLDDDVLGRLRQSIYRLLKNSPAGRTCDEIEELLGLRHQTASARLRELQLGGWIQASNHKRLTRSGRQARVYYPEP
jgi:predicted ArsR family transcriptional regulator